MKFYFTFGLVNQPFTGGWVVINADSRAQACMLFRAAFQPDDEMLNCCSIYEEREFKRTKMYRENDNFGSSCHCELGLKIEFPTIASAKAYLSELMIHGLAISELRSISRRALQDHFW